MLHPMIAETEMSARSAAGRRDAEIARYRHELRANRRPRARLAVASALDATGTRLVRWSLQVRGTAVGARPPAGPA